MAALAQSVSMLVPAYNCLFVKGLQWANTMQVYENEHYVCEFGGDLVYHPKIAIQIK